MSHYRRNYIGGGGTFFFTVKLADPKSRLLIEHIDLLREAYAFVQKRYPFETIAICVMPNHLHAVWALPDGDIASRSLHHLTNRVRGLRHTPYQRHNAFILCVGCVP